MKAHLLPGVRKPHPLEFGTNFHFCSVCVCVCVNTTAGVNPCRLSLCLSGGLILSHLYEEGYQANTFSMSPRPLPRVSSALIAIGQYSSTIETVDAGWCKDITDQGATQIAQSSKSLRYLGLMRCDKVRTPLHSLETK